MKRKFSLCLLIAFLSVLPSAQAGTKEEVMRLQSDVLQLQNQIREFEKTFNERIDGLKSLVVQLNDALATSGVTLNKISTSIETQSSGTRSADQNLAQEIRALSAKIDDTATRISALAQQVSELKVQYKSLSQEQPQQTSTSPDSLYSQAMRDFVQENFDLAIKGFTEYVNTYPGGDKAAAALCNIGEAYRIQRKAPQAISAFTRVINDYPGTDSVASALYKRAMIEVSMQERENAVADFKAVIEKFPTTPEAGLAKDKLQEMGVKPAKQPAKVAPRKSR